MTVWLVNDGGNRQMASGKDYHDAARFGTISLVSKSFVFPDTLDDNNRIAGPVMASLKHCADRYDPYVDYLLPVGDIAQIVQLTAMITVKCLTAGQPLRMLRYDRPQRAYYPIEVTYPIPLHV